MSTVTNFTNHWLKSFFKLKIVFSNRGERNGLGRREKWPQKIGRKEKGPKKIGRRENQHEKGEGRMS